MSLLKTSVGSNWPALVQPASASASASAELTRSSKGVRFIGMSSAFAARRYKLAQNFGAAARPRRRQRIGDDHVGPLPRRRHVACLPGGERQKLTRSMAERAVGGRQRLKPRADFGVWRGIDEQEAGAHRRQILNDLAGAPVAGDLIVSFHGGFFVCLRELGCFAQPREYAIAGSAIDGELGKGRVGL